jgi:phage tail sheath protein FI
MVYSSPGVFVEEEPSVLQTIAGANTSTAAFVGLVPDTINVPKINPDFDPTNAANQDPNTAWILARFSVRVPPCEACLFTNFTEFQESFGDFSNDQSHRYLSHAVFGFFNNGGSRCYVTRILRSTQIEQALSNLEAVDEVATIAAPGLTHNANRKPEVPANAESAPPKITADATEPAADKASRALEAARNAVTDAESAKAAVGAAAAALDAANKADRALEAARNAVTEAESASAAAGAAEALNAAEEAGRALEAARNAVTTAADRALEAASKAVTEAESVAVAVHAPVVRPADKVDSDAATIRNAIVAHCARTRRFGIFDAPEEVATDKMNDAMLPQEASKDVAIYFPWLQVFDPAMKIMYPNSEGTIFVPPSGHMAGVYARTDSNRGVHKAPANETVFGAKGLRYSISRAQQDGLNPLGINCIRSMNGNIRVWGARTAGGNRNGEWRYLNVRRVFQFLSKSIDYGTQWAVFEPNDQSLWAKITRNVSAFLTDVYHDGALLGASPADAFFVKCDAETNPQSLRDVGCVTTVIGVSIVRPAEFVIFRLSQWSGPNAK